MQPVTVPQIEERLQQLPPEKLAVVYDFVSYLAQQEAEQHAAPDSAPTSDVRRTMLASEAVLRRDWDTPEEDEAWADL